MQYFATQNLMLKLNSVVDKGQNKQKKKKSAMVRSEPLDCIHKF